MGLTENLCLMFVDVCFVLCMCRDWFCGLTWEGVYIWEEFWNVRLLMMMEFDCPAVDQCCWQDVHIQWPANQPVLLMLVTCCDVTMVCAGIVWWPCSCKVRPGSSRAGHGMGTQQTSSPEVGFLLGSGLIDYIALFTPPLSRLIELACCSTWVTSFITRFFNIHQSDVL